MNGSELLQKARAAVKAARDFEPVGEHYTESEVEELGRLCRDAYLATKAAGTSIGAVRVALFREEHQQHQQRLEAICAELKVAALAQSGRRAA